MRFTLAVLLLFVCTSVIAGPKVNNGGGGWICSDRLTGKTRWIKTVDLVQSVEDRQVDQKFLRMPLQNLTKAINARLAKTSPDVLALMKRYTLDLKKVQFIDFPLQDTQDFNLVNKPENSTCENGKLNYIQLANTLFDGRVLIDKAAWKKLPELQKVALILHERLYFAFRAKFDDQFSDRTRDVVSAVFSDLPNADLKEYLSNALRSKYEVSPLDEPIATFAVNVSCEASRTSNVSHADFVEKWSESADNSEENVSFLDSGLRYQVELSRLDGVPTRLIIFQLDTGAQFVFNDAKATFLQKRSVEINSYVRVNGVDSRITLSCKNN